MAKKTRKPNLPEETLARARQELGDAPVAAAPVEDDKPHDSHSTARPAPKVQREVNLREAYAYVITDLRNMAILAVGLMVFMAVMSLFI
ncbi:MAG: hypothetical protein JW910_07050 [Anaerolineae bacterium]|nr:hypothetical protein [Anaerolineae bacterium]